MPEIGKLLDKIESNEIVLPEFQREFVWKKDQAKELLKSLYAGYPIGSLLIWETKTPPEIKNDAVNREQYGLFKVLLDGQQRVTVLYLLCNNEIPPYYEEKEIHHDPRKLYFNLKNGEFRYENRTIRKSLEWVKVTDIFEDKVNEFEIAEAKSNGDSSEIVRLSKEYQDKMKRLQRIESMHIPVEELPKSADVHQAIDLFDKVNSQGTDLGDAELTLAHMSAQWPHIRRKIKERQRKLKDEGFSFRLEFFVKCLVGVITNSMTYEKAHDTPEDKLKEKWNSIKKVFDEFLISFLKNESYMPDSSYFSTKSVLIPLIVYLEKNNARMNSDEKKNFQQWLYAALMWSRYGGSTDTKLEKDISLLGGAPNPTQDLMEEIKDERGRIEVQPSDLDGRGKRSKRFYNMVRIIVRANNPVDWVTGQPLKGSYELESHHIFPKSKLYGNIYSSKNHMGKKRVNEIANRAFLNSHSNKELSNKLPKDYLPEVKENHPKALESQLIPNNPNLWILENYEYFLSKRRELLAGGINEFFKSLFVEDGKERSLEDLIKTGENYKTEFKETMLYDVYRERANKELKEKIAKEVAAFANSSGGNLIIGVKDNPVEVVGIDRDLKLMKKGLDSFELRLNQVISDKLGDKFSSINVQVEFEELEGETVCVASVEPSSEPVYFGNNREFYVRQGSSSKPLNIEQANKYIDEHWQ